MTFLRQPFKDAIRQLADGILVSANSLQRSGVVTIKKHCHPELVPIKVPGTFEVPGIYLTYH